jgi:hypothetical protein
MQLLCFDSEMLAVPRLLKFTKVVANFKTKFCLRLGKIVGNPCTRSLSDDVPGNAFSICWIFESLWFEFLSFCHPYNDPSIMR